MININGVLVDDTDMRHGDVVTSRIDKLPKDLKEIKDNIVAHGESGNKHALQGAGQLLENGDGTMFIQTQAECEVVHEEHLPMKFQAQDIRQVIIEEEYDYYDKELKKVMD